MKQSTDQNCLLSKLWGSGASPVTLDLQASKRTMFSSQLKRVPMHSNVFIKAMCGGNSEWDNGERKIKKGIAEILDFTHLSVRPREFMATQGLQFDACVLLYKDKNNVTKKISLPLSEFIFTSIMNASDSAHIMTKIHGDMVALSTPVEDILKTHCLIFFQNSNIGPDVALKRILKKTKIDSTENE